MLPETRKRIEINIPGENRLMIIGASLVVAALAVYAALTSYAGTLEADLDGVSGRLAALNQQRIKTDTANQALISLSKQSGLASRLLANHLFWTKALANIETALQPQVRLKTYSASAIKQQVSLDGVAPSYTVIARQIAAFVADDALADIDFKDAKADPLGGLRFSIDLTFDATKFLKKQP